MSLSKVGTNYIDPAVAASYDRERFHSPVGRLFDRLEKRALRRALARVRLVVPQPTTLDAPCGTGRITEWLLQQGLAVTAGDISPAMLTEARARCANFADRVTFQQLDLVDTSLPHDSFDLVTCIRLFHHLSSEERQRILSELARVSRCYVIVNVSFSSPFYRFRRRVKRWLRQGISAASSTEAEIANEAELAGLRVEGRYYLRRYASEDLVLLLRKEHADVQASQAQAQCR